MDRERERQTDPRLTVQALLEPPQRNAHGVVSLVLTHVLHREKCWRLDVPDIQVRPQEVPACEGAEGNAVFVDARLLFKGRSRKALRHTADPRARAEPSEWRAGSAASSGWARLGEGDKNAAPASTARSAPSFYGTSAHQLGTGIRSCLDSSRAPWTGSGPDTTMTRVRPRACTQEQGFAAKGVQTAALRAGRGRTSPTQPRARRSHFLRFVAPSGTARCRA